MKLRNPKTSVPYWDDCNKNLYPWFRKGSFKKILRKRFIRRQIKAIELGDKE